MGGRTIRPERKCVVDIMSCIRTEAGPRLGAHQPSGLGDRDGNQLVQNPQLRGFAYPVDSGGSLSDHLAALMPMAHRAAIRATAALSAKYRGDLVRLREVTTSGRYRPHARAHGAR